MGKYGTNMLLHARVLTDGQVKKTYKRNERYFKTIKGRQAAI